MTGGGYSILGWNDSTPRPQPQIYGKVNFLCETEDEKVNTAPKAPKHLSKEAAQWWNRIQETYGIDDDGGLLLLATALESFDAMRHAQEIVAAEGMTFLDRFEKPRAHPLLNVIRDCRSQMVQALRHLNLDVIPTKGGN